MKKRPLEPLDKIVDVVLSYHPKPKTKPAKKRNIKRRNNLLSK